MKVQYVGVIGAGTMGNGIAHVFAQNGFEVILVDINEAALSSALKTIERNLQRMLEKGKIQESDFQSTLGRIDTATDFEALKNVDFVVEAATENPDLKAKIFKQLDSVTRPEVILATNTSSISITEIAAHTHRPEKVIGMHFMNPVPLMPLVEVINGYSTTTETTAFVLELCQQLDKTPVSVEDYPGFVANRILMPMLNEAIQTLHQGVAGVKEIDAVMKLGMAHPMGPLQLADFIGLDVCQFILEVMHKGLNEPKYAPNPLLKKMVAAGKLGVKSGEGFYDYSESKKAEIVAAAFT